MPTCPAQQPPLVPTGESKDIDYAWRPELDADFLSASADRLSRAVQLPTVSYDHMGAPLEDPRFKVFGEMHAFLRDTFPQVHQHASNITKVNEWALLYKFEAESDEDKKKKPYLLAAHQDVVPVPQETVPLWDHAPFSGFIEHVQGASEDYIVHGRGASDDKNMLIAIFEALEHLFAQGWKPSRSFYIASGHTEEVGGNGGATEIAKVLQAELVPHPSSSPSGSEPIDFPIEWIIDEGGLGVGLDHGIDVAMVGASEKGYLDVQVRIDTPGGHSSMPPAHTGIGLMSRVLAAVEDHPHAPSLSPANPVLTHLICVADEIEKSGRVAGPGSDGAAADEQTGESGFQLTARLRKFLRSPAKWQSVADVIGETGTRVQRFIITTSSAIDLIQGGAKVNALPETVTATINHRVSVDSSTTEARERLARVVAPVAKKYNLELVAYGEKVDLSGVSVDGETIHKHGKHHDDKKNKHKKQKQPSVGTLSLIVDLASEPTRVSPSDNDAWALLAGTISHVYEGTDGRRRLTTPTLQTGNTDVRRYSFANLSENIWRFTPTRNRGSSNVHTVNEKQSIKDHAEATRFLYSLILNGDAM